MLVPLLSNAAAQRNLCILAHVDHGKTTLADSLLATNGILSSKLAGKVRFLDMREDEQRRGITMEASGISLYFKVLDKGSEKEAVAKEYMVSLIDAPGHVDFSSEVSTAARLCDGALVLVDVVEGVCTQTHTVLRQAWMEGIRPLLVLNKIDRLITELKLSPAEAYYHLKRTLEQVNAIIGTFFQEKRLADESKKLEHRDDSALYFDPSLGNVLFASATDGWAFRLDLFASLHSARLKCNESALRSALWGDFYFDPKTKRVIGHKQLNRRPLKPLFVQLVLDNIWAIYDAAILNHNPDKIDKIVQTLGIKLLPRELKTKDTKTLTQSIMSAWLPLASEVLLAVVDILPSPLAAQKVRLPQLLHPDIEPAPPAQNELERALYGCISNGDVCLVSKMISVPKDAFPQNKKVALTADEMRARGKIAREERLRLAQQAAAAAATAAGVTEGESGVISLPISAINSNASETVSKPVEETTQQSAESASNEPAEVIVGYTRVLSGTLRVGQSINVLSPKYNHLLPREQQIKSGLASTATIEGIYIIMGRDLHPVQEAPAGCIVGITGLGDHIIKNGTLSTTLDCPSLVQRRSGSDVVSAPILRVAIEPEDPSDLDKLVAGLKLLNHSDPCVEVIVQETGEHVLMTAGELHLERCLTDLRERFAKIELTVSKPIVPFRETIVSTAASEPLSAIPTGYATPFVPSAYIVGKSATVSTPGGIVSITVSARPLPDTVREYLETATAADVIALSATRRSAGRKSTTVDTIDAAGAVLAAIASEEAGDAAATVADSSQSGSSEAFLIGLEKAIRASDENPDRWRGVTSGLWALGPKRVGPNLLVNKLSGQSAADSAPAEQVTEHDQQQQQQRQLSVHDFEESIHTGFQLATLRGPLCAEPTHGVCFFVESVQIDHNALQQASTASSSGHVITATKEALHLAFMQWSPRLMLATYSCDIQASSDVLGKVYAVIARRKGRILSEELREGTPYFEIKSAIPVIESFGFADEMRKKTSGQASPQLIFRGFEMLDEDPFWVPHTEEELEDLGEKADRENLARKYMDAIRKRKGMFVERKLVKSAEKQRTLKRN
ncbi:translation elongation factor 2 [Ramicandelaber brevisporus]|nr:translation elongation factor 2 [Ramicandelaber brevisporus]